jgi:hypothetical protein
MARMRVLKPEFWSDGNMTALTRDARLFYIGMWNFACDGGHVPADPMALKLQILPADDVDPFALVNELLDMERIQLRETEGRKYLSILRFRDHQKIDARWQSRCPYCKGEQADKWLAVPLQTVAAPRRNSREPRRASTQTQESPDRGSESPDRGSESPDRGSERLGEARRSSGVEWSGEVPTPRPDTATNGARAQTRRSPIEQFMAAFSCTQNEALALNNRMKGEIHPKVPSAMAAALIENGTAKEWLSAHRAAAHRADVESEERRLRRLPACRHGVFGGAETNAVTRKRRCADCDARMALDALNATSRSPQ